MHKQGFALNNLHGLICHKTNQPTNQTSNKPYAMHVVECVY